MKKSGARRFAKALIEVAREEKAFEVFGKDLRTAFAVFQGTPELYKVLLNPMYKVEERKALMTKVSESLKLSPYVGRFLNILVEGRKIQLIEDIVDAYSRLEDEFSGRLKAIVEAPVDLDSSLLDEIKKKIKETTGRDVVIAFHKNPSLIGGVVVKIDNTILDGSVKTQLELMKEKILEGVV